MNEINSISPLVTHDKDTKTSHYKILINKATEDDLCEIVKLSYDKAS